MMLIHRGENEISLSTWPIDGGSPRFNRVCLRQGFEVRHAVPDSARIVASRDNKEFVALSSLDLFDNSGRLKRHDGVTL